MIQGILLTTWVEVVFYCVIMFGGFFAVCSVFWKIQEKTGIEDKDGIGSCLVIIVFGIIIAIVANLKRCKCEGKGYHEDYNPSDQYWENTPRHTLLHDSINGYKIQIVKESKKPKTSG